jgi:hypothetical protein
VARLIWTGAGLVLVALLLAYNVLPTATGDRPLRVSTPNPFPQAEGAPVALAPGARACLSDIPIDARAEVALLRARTPGARPVPLAVTFRGRGYRDERRVARYADDQDVRVPFAAPRADLIGEVCVANAGRARVLLQGSTEPKTNTGSLTSVDGTPVPEDVSLLFVREPRSPVSDAPAIVDRAAAFGPALLGAPVLWLLGVLVLLGVPAAVMWAYGRAVSERHPAPR